MPNLKLKLRKINNSRRFGRVAHNALKTMSVQPAQADKVLCREYAADVLGSKQYAPWLYIYAAVAGTFREGWIPDDYFKQYVVWPSSYAGFSNRRTISAAIFRDAPIPDICYLVDGRMIAKDGTGIPQTDAVEFLFTQTDKVIFKTDNSTQGKGISFYQKGALTTAELFAMPNGVFQKLITQYEPFNAVSPQALATLRITTAIDPDGVVRPHGTLFRMGRTGSTHINTDGGFHTVIHEDTGALIDYGYTANYGSKHTEHPDTGQLLKDVVIPHFAEIKKLTTDLHQQFPYPECMGWDIGFDQDGQPQILEMNTGHVSIRVNEAMSGPNFKGMGWENRWKEDRYN